MWNVVRQEQCAWDSARCMHEAVVDHKSIKHVNSFLCVLVPI